MNDPSGPIFRLPPFTVEATFVSLAETVDWGLANFHVPDHWKTTKGEQIKVAVLDTGIEETHPDLSDAIDAVEDFTGSRSGPADRQGHGTHVAGTIAARQNSIGVVGIAPECRLLVGKVLGDDGSGSGRGVADGIDWACDAGAEIISMSLGSPMADPLIEQAVRRAAAKGKFIIAAAGNDGRPNTVNFPARWRETIAVAAIYRHGRVAQFSSRGPQVDIAAPGQDILSTFTGGGYAKLSGTSMATPFVSGVVALLLALDRQADAQAAPIHSTGDLRAHLKRTATDAGPQGHDPAYGWGLINPDSLLAPGPAEGETGEFKIGDITVNGLPGTLVFVPS